jgi:hypothetical protein
MPTVDWRRFTLRKITLVDRSRKQNPTTRSASSDRVNIVDHSESARRSHYIGAAGDQLLSQQMSANSSRPSTSYHSHVEYRDFNYQPSGGHHEEAFPDDLSDAAGEPLASDRAVDLIPKSAKPLVSRTIRRQSVGENSATTKTPTTTINHTSFGGDSRPLSEPSLAQGDSKTNKSKSVLPHRLNTCKTLALTTY